MIINHHEILVLYDGVEVPLWLYHEVLDQIKEIIDIWPHNTCYTLKNICDREFWDSLTQGEQRLAGKCVPHMIISGVLPLECTGKNRANALLYRKKKWV